MKVESIAECTEHSAILLTFIKQLKVLKTNFLSSFEWPLMTGLTVSRLASSKNSAQPGNHPRKI